MSRPSSRKGKPMNKRRICTLVLAAAMLLALGATAFAANTTTATVPVTLTVSNEYRAVNVTVPAALPVEVINGVVITADNARITNNSKGTPIQVTKVSVTDGAYKVSSYRNFSGSQSIALKINGCETTGSGALSINSTAFPEIRPEDSQKLTYYAKVSGDAPNAKDVKAANVVFTIAIAD